MKNFTFTLLLFLCASLLYAQPQSPSLNAEVLTQDSEIESANGFLLVSISASEEADFPVKLYVGSHLVANIMSDQFAIGMPVGELNEVLLMTADGELHEYGTLIIDQLNASVDQLMPVTNLCAGQSVELNVPGEYESTVWSTSQMESSIQVTPNLSQVYYAIATDAEGESTEFAFPVNLTHFDVHYYNFEDINCDGIAVMTLEIYTNNINSFPINITAQQGENEFDLGSVEESNTTLDNNIGTYSNLIFFDANGCTISSGEIQISQAGHCSDNSTELNFSITSNETTIEVNEAVLCSGAQAFMEITGDEGLNWNWSGPQGYANQGSLVSVDVINNNTSGEYMAQAGDSNGNNVEVFFNLHVVDLGDDVESCSSVDVEYNLPEGPSYLWSDGTEGASYTGNINENTTLSVQAVDAFGCVIAEEINFTISNEVEIYQDPIVACAETVHNLVAPEGYVSYLWNTGETNISKDLMALAFETAYVDCFSANGCSTRYHYSFDIVQEFRVFLTPTEGGNCTTGFVEVLVIEDNQAVYPVEIYGVYEGENLLLAVANTATSIADLPTGLYENIFAIASVSCDFALDSLNLEFQASLEEIDMPSTPVCPDQFVSLEAPDGYQSYLWSTGNTMQNIFESPMPGPGYWVDCTDNESCVQRFNYSIEFIPSFSASVTPTGNSTDCETGEVEIQVVAQGNSVYPVTLIGNYGGELVTLATITEHTTTHSLDGGSYTGVIAMGEGSCEFLLENFEVIPAFRYEEIDMPSSPVCPEQFISLEAPDGYQSYLWSTGSTLQNIFESPTPGPGYWVDCTDNESCIQRFNYSIEFISSFSVFATPTGNSSNCQTGEIEIQVASQSNAVYPVTLMGTYEGEQITLAILNESNAYAELQGGEYTDLFAMGRGSCEAAVNNFTITPDFRLEEVNMDPVPVCPEEFVSLNAPDGFQSYLWSTGSTLQNIFESPTPGQDYWVDCVDNESCIQRFNYSIDFVNSFAVFPVPTGESATCNSAEIDFQVFTNQQSVYPIELQTQIEGTLTTIAVLNGASTILEIATGSYDQLIAIGQGACIYAGESFVVESNVSFEEIDLNPLATCDNAVHTLEAPVGYQSYVWSSGEVSQSIEKTVSTGSTFWVDCTDGQSCTQRYNYSFDLVEDFSLSTNQLEGSETCTTAMVEISVITESEAVFPIEVMAQKDGTLTTIATLSNQTEIVELDGGAYTEVIAMGQLACNAEMSDFEVSPQPMIGEEVFGIQLVCPNAGVSLTAPDGYESYLWSTGQTVQSFSTLPNPNNIYYVDCTSADGCFQRFHYEFDFINVFEVNVEAVSIAGNCQSGAADVEVITDNNVVYPVELTADFQGNRVSIGMVNSEQETMIFPVGEYLNVFAKSSNGCSYQVDDLIIEGGESPEPTYADVLTLCDEVEFSLEAPVGFNAYLWNNGSSDASIFAQASDENLEYYVDCTNAEGCSQRFIYPISIVNTFYLALFETDQSQGCEFAYIDTYISTDNDDVFPVQIEATIEGETYVVGTVENVNGSITLAPGLYESIQAIGSFGCGHSISNYEVIVETFSAAMNVTDPVDACDPGTVDLTITNANLSDYPMNLTAFDFAIGDWIEIGVVNGPSEIFFLEGGLYQEVELIDQNDCIVYFDDISMTTPQEPCDQSPQGRIASRVFFDSNMNGVADADEPGVRDVVVTAVNNDGEIVAVQMSNSNGSYTLEDLPEDNYFLHFDLPSTMSETSPNVGSDEAIDSDIDHSNGIATTAFFNVNNEETVTNIGAGVGGFVLPLEWGYIQAENKGKSNLVSWSTVIEEQITHFIIERASSESFDFEEIEIVEAQGSAYEAKEYQYFDRKIEGLSEAYYRITSIDILSQTSTTEVVYVKMENESKRFHVSVYPNPTSDYVQVDYDQDQVGQDLSLRVIASSGASQELSIPASFTTGDRVDLTALATGTYVLEVKMGRSIHRETIVFVKQ